MNKLTTAALGLAVAVLPVLAASPAFAADDLTCDAAEKLVVKAQARVDTRAAEELLTENAAVDAAQAKVNEAQVALDKAVGDAVPDARKLLREARDVLRDAKADRDADSKRLAELRVLLEAAIADRDEACSEPTTTPATPTTPANEDVDCDEVTDARAQEILDADRNDPHNLDDDNDGVACEEEEVLVADNDSVVVAPSGGVNTGGWRR